MKKLVLVITLAAIALSGSAFAQDPTYTNNIGIFLDETGSNNCGPLGIGTHPGYVVLTNLTGSEVLGWEAKFSFDNLYPSSLAHRGQAIDAGSREGEHIVGFASPLAIVGGACVVADVELLVINADPAYAYVDEVYFSLLENGLPAYIDAASMGYTLHPVNAASDDQHGGSVNVPIFIANGDCLVVATEESSFGSVKSLYR